MARTTALNVRSTVKHLQAFIGGDAPLLKDVDADKAFRFRTEYLPVHVGLKPQTVAKHMTLLRGMWAWAITDKRYVKGKNGRRVRNLWIVAEKGTPRKKSSKPNADETRTAFTPEQVGMLLKGFAVWGSRQCDLIRLVFATGCRIDEVGSLKLANVERDGSAFRIVHGKTDNAIRRIPFVEDAQRLLAERVVLAEELQQDVPEGEKRLFPEWPLKPSTGKVNSASQWFKRYRRQSLGAETDGKLAMHSFRHTWRTVARRAGVPEDRIRELGGWEGKQDASQLYDHGLEDDQLAEVQTQI